MVEDESFELDLDENFKCAMDLVIEKMEVPEIKKKNFLARPGKDGNQDAYDEDDYERTLRRRMLRMQAMKMTKTKRTKMMTSIYFDPNQYRYP